MYQLGNNNNKNSKKKIKNNNNDEYRLKKCIHDMIIMLNKKIRKSEEILE